jgi:hypothetical protein
MRIGFFAIGAAKFCSLRAADDMTSRVFATWARAHGAQAPKLHKKMNTAEIDCRFRQKITLPSNCRTVRKRTYDS